MTSKHTPGPWWVCIDDTGGEFTGWPSVAAPEDADATVIHRAGFKQEYWGDWSMREANANAHLIAAAPDMYEALIDLRAFIRDYSGPTIDRIRAKADAAITKAENSQ